MNEDNIIFLINPTTLKYHRIPTFHLALPVPGSFNMYGLGYDSAGDDYKVVTLSRYYEDRWDFATNFVDVYSVKTGLWRRIQSSTHVQIRLWFGSGVLVNGALHWMAHKGINLLYWNWTLRELHIKAWILIYFNPKGVSS